MKSKRLFGSLLLIITALIWGCAFVVQSVAMDSVGPFTFNSIRMIIGAVVLLPFIAIRDGISKKNGGYKIPEAKDKKNLIIGGIICGAVLFVASSLQQFGLNYGTSSGKAGFITAFYILLVPICGLFLKKRVRPLIWICVAVALIGLYLLCINEGFSVAPSDILVLICAFGFTAHILVIDKYSPLVDGVKLSCIQFFTAGIIGIICMFIFEKPDITAILSAWPLFLYAGGLSSGVAYTLQIVAQKHVQPTVACLLMSLESVFAVLAGIVFLKQLPSVREFAGCLLMFAAIIVSQLPERKKNAEA